MSKSILFSFPFSSCHATAKEEIKKYVKQLVGKEEKPEVDVRIRQVEVLLDSYVEATGERPDSFELFGLGGYILADYLGDQYKHLRKDEHPFQTDNRVRKNHARNKTIFLGDRDNV
jgi:hypothetical protein